MAKNHPHLFSVDLQPFEAAVLGDDMSFRLLRAVDRSKAGDDALGLDHSQNIKAFDNRAGVGYESLSLAAPALAGDMRVG